MARLVGQAVALRVGPESRVAEHPRGEHRVFKLVAFPDAPGMDSAGPGPEPRPAGHGGDESAESTGKVERLNHAKHGEASGVVLEGGEFIHLKPERHEAGGGEDRPANDRPRQEGAFGVYLDDDGHATQRVRFSHKFQ